MLDDAEISRVLAIAAHPDDLDFSAAGTIARWTEAGLEVVYCIVTDGDAGGFDEDFPREEMPALRRAEQVAAAKCVGVHDHRAVGAATLDAVYPDARNPFAFPELREHESLAAWTVREVWIAGGPDPDHYVDVTGTFGRKLAALRAHESQTGHMADLAERIRTRLTLIGQQAGLPDGSLAEGFRVLDTA